MRALMSFWKDEEGQDYIEYFLLAGAAAAIFAAVGARFKDEIIATINFVIRQLQGARR